jgi:adenylate kinase family enzyme
MILGISGSQGQGKTTLSRELMLNHNMPIINPTMARSVIHDTGFSLDEINTKLKLKARFQEKLLEKLKSSYTDDQICSDNIFIMDRTYLDLFVYTLIGLGQYNDYSNFVNDYYEQCVELSKGIGATYILTGREADVQPDSIRGYNIHYSSMVNNLIIHFSKKIITNFYAILNLSSLTQRVDAVVSYVGILNGK